VGERLPLGRKPREPLPESISCEVCSATVKPKKRTQRFCSQHCYHFWWLTAVKQKAADARGAAIRQAIQEDRGPRRGEGGKFRPALTAPRVRQPRPAEPVSEVDWDDIDEGEAWAARAEYWTTADPEPAPRLTPFGAVQPDPKPLVLNGHGVRLHVHQGALVVRNGFTHYPQQNPEMRLFPGRRQLPSRLIVLDSDGSISFDVIAWLSRHRIPLVMLNWQGDVVSVVGEGSAYDPDLREAQLKALTNGAGLRLATHLIRQKVEGGKNTLSALWRSSISAGATGGRTRLRRRVKADRSAGGLGLLRCLAGAANQVEGYWAEADPS
jgi:CRISPR associated protein Cas1